MNDFDERTSLQREIEQLRTALGEAQAALRALRAGSQESSEYQAAAALPPGHFIERNQVERTLRESEDRFRTLVQNSSDIITILSITGEIIYESLSVQRVLGYDIEEVLSRSAFDMIHPDDMPIALMHFAQLVEYPEQKVTAELRYKHKDDSWRLLEVSARNFLDHPVIQGIVLNSRDVTERRSIESALRESEERYRLVALATNDVMWDWNLLTGEIHWNEALSTAFGYEINAVTNRADWWLERVHPDERDAVDVSIRLVQDGEGHYWNGEYRFLRADGDYAYVRDRGYVVRDANGQAIRMIGAMTDFSEKKRAEENLQQALEELRNIYRQSTDMISIVSQTHFLRVNPAFSRILGYTEAELLATPYYALLHPDDLNTSTQEVDRMAREPAPTIEFENRFRCKDGSYRRIAWNATPFVNGTSYVAGRDITERYMAQEEIRALNAELEQRVVERTAQLTAVNKELEAFSYSVSHDLRAPLRALDGFSLALLEDYSDELPDEAQHFLNRIRTATQRMGRLIDDLLDLSRLTRNEMRIEEVNLSQMAHALVRDLREIEPQRQVEVQIAEGLEVQGDARLLWAALFNLFANAWKFTGRQANARIEFGTMTMDDAQVFFVRDNGVGFDMAYADKLFGAFQRLHTQSEFEGTGVGLATVQRVIHRHGGEVWADSSPGAGATFYFTI